MDKKVTRNLSYGVYVVSAMDGERPTGCTANSVMQITSEPASLAVSINHDNYTNKCIKGSGMFSVSILNEDCDPSVIGHFGFQSGKDVDKYADMPYDMILGVPVCTKAGSYMVCKVISSMETSSHTVFLGEVLAAEILTSGTPMTYAYYHNVIKGKSPKNAPTYIAEEEGAATASEGKWQCGVCKYVYDGSDGPFEELPDDWKCPVCGQPKSVFEKID